MRTGDVDLPKPELRGEGQVLYRCAKCSELMDPADAVIASGKSYHPDHTPEDTDGR
jgi:hypothetical protein